MCQAVGGRVIASRIWLRSGWSVAGTDLDTELRRDKVLRACGSHGDVDRLAADRVVRAHLALGRAGVGCGSGRGRARDGAARREGDEGETEGRLDEPAQHDVVSWVMLS